MEKNVPSQEEIPDGGWGWVICFVGFVVQFVTFGIHNSYGIIYISFLEEFSDWGQGLTAYIGSMAFGLMFLFGPLCSYLCERFSCRVVGVCGGILAVSGLMLTSFVPYFPLMYITYGLLWGVGSCMSFIPMFIMVEKYFRKHLALACGICTAGSGIGSLAMGPVIHWLLKTLQWRQTLKVLAGQCGVIVLVSLLYKPLLIKNPVLNCRDEKAKFFDKDLLKNRGYVIWVLSIVIFVFGYYTPFIYLPSRAVVDLGINKEKASFLIGYLAIASTIGRLVFGKIADHPQVSRFYLFQGSILAIAVSTTLCPILSSYGGLVGYAVVFGLFQGSYVVLLPVVTGDIAGVKKFPAALGCLNFGLGFTMMAGPTVAGKMFEITHRYDDAFFFSGGCSAVSTIVMFLIHVFLPDKERRENLQLSNNKTYSIPSQPKTKRHKQYSPGVIDAEHLLIVDRLAAV